MLEKDPDLIKLENILKKQKELIKEMEFCFGRASSDGQRYYFKEKKIPQKEIADTLEIGSGYLGKFLKIPTLYLLKNKEYKPVKIDAFNNLIKGVKVLNRNTKKFNLEIEKINKEHTEQIDSLQNKIYNLKKENPKYVLPLIIIALSLYIAYLTYAINELKASQGRLEDIGQIKYIVQENGEKLIPTYIDSALAYNNDLYKRIPKEKYDTLSKEQISNEIKLINKTLQNIITYGRKPLIDNNFITKDGVPLIDVVNCVWSYDEVNFPILEDIIKLLLKRDTSQTHTTNIRKHISEFSKNAQQRKGLWDKVEAINNSKEYYEKECLPKNRTN